MGGDGVYAGVLFVYAADELAEGPGGFFQFVCGGAVDLYHRVAALWAVAGFGVTDRGEGVAVAGGGGDQSHGAVDYVQYLPQKRTGEGDQLVGHRRAD